MNKKDILLIESMILANGIIQNSYNFYHDNGQVDLDREWDKDTIDRIIKFSIQTCKKYNDKIVVEEEKNKNTVFCGDLIVVMIDKKTLKRYFINRNDTTRTYIQPINCGNIEVNFENLFVQTNLGRKLIGKCVGDTITYSSDDAKNEHTVEIVSIRKTIASEELNEYELDVDKKYIKR